MKQDFLGKMERLFQKTEAVAGYIIVVFFLMFILIMFTLIWTI